ncbi:742_t:CDS:2 [Funneliformis caledonium]|uniref:742_t:CDS:1 n=1 Tax=Funneliformis caledonium TaxID=1117310 RepID=A0A9N9A0B9_9GLOM|nr:742_t:CDS:2 [Funneliformis caledonium]
MEKEFTTISFQNNPDISDIPNDKVRGDPQNIRWSGIKIRKMNNQRRIDSQSETIESLRDRIDELEIDSFIQNQNIKKLQQDFNKLKIKDIINKGKCDVKGHEKLVNDNGSIGSATSPLQISSTYSEDQGSIPKLVHQIQQSITRENISLRNLRYLKHHFSINHLVRYTKSDDFNSLSERIKRLINLLIYESLSEEFQRKDVTLSQKLNEYIERGVIPALPKGYNSYKQYSESILFKKLNKILKERITKLIQIEKKLTTGKNEKF